MIFKNCKKSLCVVLQKLKIIKALTKVASVATTYASAGLSNSTKKNFFFFQVFVFVCNVGGGWWSYWEKMAEAAVEDGATNRFFCHKCSIEITRVLDVRMIYLQPF